MMYRANALDAKRRNPERGRVSTFASNPVEEVICSPRTEAGASGMTAPASFSSPHLFEHCQQFCGGGRSWIVENRRFDGSQFRQFRECFTRYTHLAQSCW